MALICSLCKRELREKNTGGPGCVDNHASVPGKGDRVTPGAAMCVAGRLSGLVYAESRIGGISKIIRVSPVAYHKS